MKLFRKRWWGFYPIAPLLGMSGFVFALFGWDNTEKGNLIGAVVTIALAITAFLSALLIYAPYTFHVLGKVLGLVVSLAYVFYLIDSLVTGKILSFSRSDSSAINALLGLFIFGIPGFINCIKAKRPVRHPYRKNGSLRKPLRSEIRTWAEEFENFEDAE